MAGVRQAESDLPPRTYIKRGTYFYVSRETGKWVSLGCDKAEAIRRGRDLYDGIVRDPTLGLDLSKLQDRSIASIGRHARTVTNVLESSRRGARDRGLTFELTMQDISDLLIEADGHCTATGIQFSSVREIGSRLSLWKPSLDRIDSRLGYVLGNVRFVCAAFNIAAQEHGDEVFEKMALGFLKNCQRWKIERL